MTQALHSQARTTHLIREEIRNSTLPQAELARLYNVTRQTIRKWQNRDTPQDKSHAPTKMYTTLSPEQLVDDRYAKFRALGVFEEEVA